ncbi:ATP-binding cassette domain-containing protein [Spiroplasma cantharicola]|uniref:ATP-binding cassette domain-containing protein n=1 Tax=Spiroplasma cantharicola TaxID=362837 RepID=UPI0006B619BF|nr:ATP-binding cassette domain-containing protein [Spiroplasma cantharicola]
MEYKFTIQKSENDCGIAVSTTLINYYHNKNFGIEEIKFDNSLNDEMLSLYDMEKLLNNYHIEFTSYKCDYEEFKNLDITNPLVLNTLNKEGNEHFIIIYKKRKNLFLVADSNLKDLTWVSEKDFKSIYQGFLSITKKIEEVKFKTKSIFNWFTFINKFKTEVLMLFLISIILNVLILITNNFLKIYMENVAIKENQSIKFLFLIFLIVFIIQNAVSYFINKIVFNIKSKVSKTIFLFYKKKLINLEIEKFNSNSKEEWMKKLEHINLLSEFIVKSTISFPLGLILFLMSSLFLILISPLILTIVIIQNIISISISIFLFYLLKEYKIKKERKLINFSYSYREILDGFEEIKYKNIEDEIKSVNYKNFNATLKETKHIFNLNNKAELFFSLLNKFFFYLIFYISIIYINQSKFTVPDLLFYTSISFYINIFFNQLTNFILDLQEIIIADKSLSFIFANSENKDSSIIVKEIKTIEAKNLYSYKSDKCALNNFNFIFNKNTFIYGKSGSGKTTLLKILSGHYKKYEGTLLINENINTNKVDIKSYRERNIYLGQYDYLFNGTVWNNIQQFKNKTDLKIVEDFKILEILERNNIDLNKKIYDNGANLSKGQRQIINFLSLFFTSKDLYLIDEPLSNVDKHTAYYLFKLFMEQKKNSLIIMCDHDIAYSRYFENRVEVI